MITKAITKAFENAKRKNWAKTYWAIDIHGTIIEPNFKINDIPKKFYPHVVETLQLLTKRTDVCLILYTCSHPHELVEYQKYFISHNIHFDFINENPEVATADYGCYDHKPYFNVLIEDKAGFDPETDWILIKELLMDLDRDKT